LGFKETASFRLLFMEDDQFLKDIVIDEPIIGNWGDVHVCFMGVVVEY
jgi:hypothetical protein